MSSCLSGGGRAYALNLDLIKSSSTFTTSNSSSSLSESTNSPLSIFTRKSRTPRKRPNQTYNEAAALLSTAYPKVFPPKNHPKPFKLTKSHDNRGPFLSEPPDLLIPFHHHGGGKGYLPQLGSSCSFPSDARAEKPCLSPGEVTSRGDLVEICDEFEEDFDAESILDEEVEEGIDSIMGNLRVEEEDNHRDSTPTSSYCYGFPVGMGFDFGCGMRNELRAMRNVDDGEWWSSTTVNVVDITRRIATIPMEKKKKKKKKKTMKTKTKMKANSASDEQKEGSLSTAATSEESLPNPAAGFRLKLNYDDVLNAWSDKGSPFSGEAPASESAGNDVQARLAQIELLFPENGAVRGAIVLRYKEKRRTRLFSNKIRYQVRKPNADQRPRIKGRFVRTPNSGEDD